MGTVTDIIDGTIKNLLNQNGPLYKERITICRDCKLIKEDMLHTLNTYISKDINIKKKVRN